MADDLAALDVPSLRARRDEVRAQEAAASYQRRIVQAQLDIVIDLERSDGDHIAARLADLLADGPTTAAGAPRAVLTRVEDLPEPPPLPDDVRSLDADERAALTERLATAERELSDRRRALLDELDALQHELVRRYRDEGVDAAELLRTRR